MGLMPNGRGEASPSGGGPDPLKSSPTKKEKAELKTGVFHSAWPASPLVHRIPTPFVVSQTDINGSKLSSDPRVKAVDRELRRVWFSLRICRAHEHVQSSTPQMRKPIAHTDVTMSKETPAATDPHHFCSAKHRNRQKFNLRFRHTPSGFPARGRCRGFVRWRQVSQFLHS
jgi:hypothetical protein